MMKLARAMNRNGCVALLEDWSTRARVLALVLAQRRRWGSRVRLPPEIYELIFHSFLQPERFTESGTK